MRRLSFHSCYYLRDSDDHRQAKPLQETVIERRSERERVRGMVRKQNTSGIIGLSEASSFSDVMLCNRCLLEDVDSHVHILCFHCSILLQEISAQKLQHLTTAINDQLISFNTHQLTLLFLQESHDTSSTTHTRPANKCKLYVTWGLFAVRCWRLLYDSLLCHQRLLAGLFVCERLSHLTPPVNDLVHFPKNMWLGSRSSST